MGMWLTTLIAIAITVLSMVWHLRRRSRTAAHVPRPATCPRCGAALGGADKACPACGVPLQAYELVLAPLAHGDRDAADGPLHAMVRADVCVGCGACVAACPEPGAIRVESKLAVVDRDLCRGHGECVRACPVNGIVLTSGEAVQRLEAPELDVHFQSGVPGLYVVGELGGRGLIKNAVNEGRIAAEHVAAETRRAARRPDTDPAVLDVLIVGSGPAGLSAGLEAQRAGLRYLVLEQGDLSDTIHRYPRHKLLLAEPVQIPVYGRLWIADASKESLIAVWRGIIERTGLEVLTHHRVERIDPAAWGFEVTAAGRRFHARRVVLAMGRRGHPRRLEVPGEDLPHVFYDIVEMEAFARSRVVVVGGGDSAVESAVGLATQPGTHVTLAHRGAGFTRIAERNRVKLESARASGAVDVLLDTRVREIRPGAVTLETAAGERPIPADYVIVRVGGDPPFAFLRELGVRIVRKEMALHAASESNGHGAEAAHA